MKLAYVKVGYAKQQAEALETCSIKLATADEKTCVTALFSTFSDDVKTCVKEACNG